MIIQKIENGVLEAICKVIGDTTTGFTGSEIDTLLIQAGINNPDPSLTKWKKLFNALYAQQEKDGCGNRVIDFIKKSMTPSKFINSHERFEALREGLNQALLFIGYELKDDAQIIIVEKAKTLSEVERRTQKLKSDLQLRSVHPQVLRFCRDELLQENYFHAVFEATKSIAERIRELTGLTDDGGGLIETAFKIEYPMLMINKLQTETEKSEQKGLVNFIKGILGMFRNTTAHAPKIKWEISEKDALEILSAISLVHRKLDNVTVTGLRN